MKKIFYIFFLMIVVSFSPPMNLVKAENGACEFQGKCYQFGENLGSNITSIAGKSTCESLGLKIFSTLADCQNSQAVVGELGCYCRVDGSSEKKNITNPFSKEFATKADCLAASTITFVDIGTLSECEWNVSEEQELELPMAGGQEEFELPEGISELNKLGTTDVKLVIGRALKVGMGIIGSIAFAMFIYGGVVWMLGTTDIAGGAAKHDVMKAKAILVWATLGLAVILSSYAIVDFVFEAFR